MDHTDQRCVKAQIDLFWLASGVSNDAATMLSMVNRYQNRAGVLPRQGRHQPDAVRRHGQPARARRRRGELRADLRRGQEPRPLLPLRVRPGHGRQQRRLQPVHHHRPQPREPDRRPGTGGGDEHAELHLGARGHRGRGQPGPGQGDQHRRRPARVHGRGADDRRRSRRRRHATAADFAVVSQDCSGRTLAPGEACTINVGFKPTRTKTTSVARLQFNSNSDDSLDRVPLIATSTGDALGGVGGDVPPLLSLNLGTGASFGTFAPADGPQRTRPPRPRRSSAPRATRRWRSAIRGERRAASSTARSRCRRRWRSGPPTPPARRRRTRRWATAG